VIWEKIEKARVHLSLLTKPFDLYSNMIAARPATPAMFWAARVIWGMAPPPDVADDAAAPAELVTLPSAEVAELPADAADSEAELAAPEALEAIELAAPDALDAAELAAPLT
jgi:hypothetical protein